ncbi:SMI1/KNR4 family protein [Massilia violaceinigra]|uniref:SMI1/KNR4 family protein n=1 Tax=Massilia violaceinigra TaxID=2045208 RepID=A0ABY4A357_9BURK|nr:SMI1/KNR4 family protein [Massilia violaceinigra]UOD29195.1 SMI1/KNR4 family protein [Massilia violaceinigra]
MISRDTIIALNARAVAADTEYPERFDLAFAAPATAQDIAALETLLNIRIPDQLRALYQECGAFRHVHYDDSYGQTIALDGVGAVLEQLRTAGDRRYGSHAGQGLVDFIHAHWGGRSDLDDILDEETVKLVNENYIAFGCRYINDDVHDYWYFDRNGMFGNLRFDQDELDYNSWKIETLCDVLPPGDLALDAAQRRAHTLGNIAIYSEPHDTFPGMTLRELIAYQFAAIVASISPDTD